MVKGEAGSVTEKGQTAAPAGANRTLPPVGNPGENTFALAIIGKTNKNVNKTKILIKLILTQINS